MEMFKNQPHINIASQVFGGLVAFIVFQIYLSSLQEQHHLRNGSLAIEQMKIRHFNKRLIEEKKAYEKDKKCSQDQP